MVEEVKVTSGADDHSPVDKSSEETQETNDTVAYATYKKALGEKKALQSKFVEAQDRLKELEAEKQTQSENALKENEQYKTLWEQEKGKREEIETNLNGLNENLTLNKKLNAFDKALGCRLKNDAYYSFVDSEKIIMDANGNIEEDSVKMAVESFRELHGDNLLAVKSAGTLPNESTEQNGTVPVGFEAELKAAKNQRELDIVLKKYNKN